MEAASFNLKFKLSAEDKMRQVIEKYIESLYL